MMLSSSVSSYVSLTAAVKNFCFLLSLGFSVRWKKGASQRRAVQYSCSAITGFLPSRFR